MLSFESIRFFTLLFISVDDVLEWAIRHYNFVLLNCLIFLVVGISFTLFILRIND